MSKEIISWVKEQFKDSKDFTQKTLEIDHKLALMFYVVTQVDSEAIQKSIIKPFFEMPTEQHFKAYIQSLIQTKTVPSKEQLIVALTSGNVLTVIGNELFLLELPKVHNADVQDNKLESTIHGSQLGLSENLSTNINVLRHNYHNASLMVEHLSAGMLNHMKLAIIYDKEKVNEEVLKRMKEKISKNDKQLIQTSDQLLNFMNNSKFALFPLLLLTERTDRIIYNIAGGKVAIVMDGTPHAIIGPTVFFDFMTSMEDNYHSFWIVQFVKLLRYLGLLTCILLPGLYVGTTSYSPEVFRTELALTIAGSRTGVPYPSFVEVLLMLFFMELLLEASIRLPKAVSATATTVGGLVLGTAATEAALASNIMIILVSAVAISTFVIPMNEMSFAMRIVRLVLLLFASLFGLEGLMLSFLGLILYMTNLNSFGEPYLRFYNYRKRKES
ncbi:spore germination protein [Chungangia koreensis]|uniref:Spore germination protein n=1 Tax=Chungangia koreensis TaxID=752657 RepID=A0ABV8X2N5_9LACT